MRTALGDSNHCRQSLSCSDGGKKEEGVGGGAYERGQRWAKAGLKVAASHCERTASRKAPLHLFVLTCLYVLFHLKVPTTGLDTEMDRKAGPGRHKGAICQNGATMLTAAVCVNISQRSEKTIMPYYCDIFPFTKEEEFSFFIFITN